MLVGVFNHIYLLPKGVWFGADKVCVSGVVDALPNRYTNRICEGHENVPSYKAVLEAIKFLPVEMVKVSIF